MSDNLAPLRSSEDIASRMSKLEEAVASLKKGGIIAIITVILGGGGVIGVLEWLYTAPAKKAVDEAEATAKNLESELMLHTRTIASLQGSIDRLIKSPSADPNKVAALEKQLAESEQRYRERLAELSESLLNAEEKFLARLDKQSESLRKFGDTLALIEKRGSISKEELAQRVADEVDRHAQAIKRTLAEQSRRIAELEKAAAEIP